MEATIKCSQEQMKSAINSIQAELEETMKHWVEDELVCVDQRTQCLYKELNEKINETQVVLQAVKKSLDSRKKNLQKSLADARKDVQGKLSLMFQV
jgi:pyrimidine operon attenuation protein/uracil phosphoribosyltransferase